MDHENNTNESLHAEPEDSHGCSAIVLREQVRAVLQRYLVRLNGHPIHDLHDLVLCEVEKPLLETVLEHTGHNQTRAAAMLGLSRSTLRKKMQQYGIE